MNPLSTVPLTAGPSFRPATIAPVPPELAAPKAIPFTELEGLSPGIVPLSSPATKTDPAGFGQMVDDLVTGVQAKQTVANDSLKSLFAGKNVSLHQTMIAMEEASISFQLMVEVRNKLLESYQELMRMQV